MPLPNLTRWRVCRDLLPNVYFHDLNVLHAAGRPTKHIPCAFRVVLSLASCFILLRTQRQRYPPPVTTTHVSHMAVCSPPPLYLHASTYFFLYDIAPHNYRRLRKTYATIASDSSSAYAALTHRHARAACHAGVLLPTAGACWHSNCRDYNRFRRWLNTTAFKIFFSRSIPFIRRYARHATVGAVTRPAFARVGGRLRTGADVRPPTWFTFTGR